MPDLSLASRDAAAAPCSRPASYRSSPVVELLDYFNERLAGLLPTGAPSPDLFFPHGGTVRARVAGAVLDSAFRGIAGTAHTRREAAAALARLVVRDRHGDLVPAPRFLARCSAAPAIVALDRACRMLHMLNHLALGRDDRDLWLHVGPRHVLGVAAGHGRFFETLLQRCGLGPERIVIVAPFMSGARPEYRRYARGLANYRGRGYRLALDLHEAWPAGAAATIHDLAPDWLRLSWQRCLELEPELPACPLLVRGIPFTVRAEGLRLAGHRWPERAASVLFELPALENPTPLPV